MLNQTVKCVDQEKNSWVDLECPISKPMRRVYGVPKINILISLPIPLSWIKNRSPSDVVWYSGGNSGRASPTIGLEWRCLFCRCYLIFLRKWSSYGRFTPTVSETFCTSVVTIFLGFSKLPHTLLLIFAFCFFTLCCWWRMCMVIDFFSKWSNSSSLIETQHSSFLQSLLCHKVILFASFFAKSP